MSIEAKEEFRPKIVAFCCNWCSYAGADLAGSSRLSYSADVKIIRVPCSCRVNPMFILRAFERGSGRRDHLRMPSGRLPLYIRQLLCQKKDDTFILHAGLYRCGKRTDPCGVGICGRGCEISQTMHEFVEKIQSLGKNVRLEDLRCRK